MLADSVPIIDISPFLAGDDAGKQAVAEQVADACTSIGFFAISGHGVPQDIIEDLREASHTFFEQPEDVKRRSMHPITDTPRGFRALAGEALGRTVRADATPDLKEFYHYGPETWPNEPYFTSPDAENYFIPNLWPDEPTAFRKAADLCRRLALATATIDLAINCTVFQQGVHKAAVEGQEWVAAGIGQDIVKIEFRDALPVIRGLVRRRVAAKIHRGL